MVMVVRGGRRRGWIAAVAEMGKAEEVPSTGNESPSLVDGDGFSVNWRKRPNWSFSSQGVLLVSPSPVQKAAVKQTSVVEAAGQGLLTRIHGNESPSLVDGDGFFISLTVSSQGVLLVSPSPVDCKAAKLVDQNLDNEGSLRRCHGKK
nr:hypothetical protein Iba_chr10dCG8230 [Ipomoea batatas]